MKTSNLFRILTKINPLIALLGTFCLSNNYKLGWYILIMYNICNIYIYTKKRKDFWVYALVSCLHLSFGIWALCK